MKKILAFVIILVSFASSAFAERVLTLLEPVGLEVWITGTHDIRWQRTGTSWTPSDTLKIEYSSDGGTNWTLLAASVLASPNWYPWDVTGMPPSPFYRARLTCNEDLSVTIAGGDFRIGILTFYVNDTSTSNDKYCTAAGSPVNNGLTPAAPNTSVQYIVDTYNLEGGDLINIDTGVYPLTANITVGAADGGDSGNPVRFVGATELDGTLLTVLDRNAAGISTSRVFEATGAYVRVDGIKATRGYYGINLAGTGGEALNCEVYGNGNVGVNVPGSGNTVADCLVRDNTGTGINGTGTITGNTVQNNTTTGIYCSGGTTTGNTVRNNTGDGIYAYAQSSAVTVSNNLSVSNGSRGLYMYTSNFWSQTVTAVNNTLAGNGSHGAYYYRASGGTCNFRNNIVHTDGAGKVCFYIQSSLSGTFDYNTYYATGGAGVGYNAGATRPTLGEWRTSTGQDANSLNVNPLFVNPAGGDYHVMSTEGSYHDGAWTDDAQSSPTIDAGQPDSTWPYDYEAEPCPNGSRINQGFDGGTAQASKTPGEHPTVVSVAAVTLRSIDVTFSHAMGVGVTEPANYTLSGDGMGNLAAHPDSVVLRSGNTYTLTWGGGEMRNGATATVTVAPVQNVQDLLCYHVDENANSGQTPGIGVLPTITVNPLTTRNRTPLLSGTIQDNESGICGCEVTVNGHVYPGTVNGTNWSAQVTDLLDGDPPHTYDVDARATDCAGNTALDPTNGELTIDILTPTTVDAILATDPTPTNVQTVHFTAYFSMHVENVQIADFVIDASGGLTGATVTAVQVVGGSDNTQWTVTVDTGAGDGSLSIDLIDADLSIVDIDGYPLGGSFVNGQVYQIDKTSPTVSLSSPHDPTNASVIPVTVTFDEPVSGFDAGDINAAHATVGNFTVVSSSEYTFELTPNPADYQGAITADIPADAAHDAAANGNMAAPQLSVTRDTIPPTVDISAPSALATENDPVTYTVTYDGADTVSLTKDNVHLIETGEAQGEVFVSDAKAVFTRLITIDNIEGQGTLTITIDDGTSCDAAGNCDLGFAGVIEVVSVGSAVPVAGIVSVGLLAAACVLSGLGAIKRRR